VPDSTPSMDETLPTVRTARSKLTGSFGRARGQSLGVLALAMSVAVVIFAVFVLPHDAPAAVHTGTSGHTKPSGGKTRTAGNAGSKSTATTSPGTTTTSVTQSGKTPESISSDTKPPPSSNAPVVTAPITSTVTTSTTTTQPPAYVPPHVATESWPGNLGDPYASASYQLTTTGGEVSASATWSGTPTLSLELSCTDATKSQSGSSNIYVSADAQMGNCTITIAEPAGVEDTVSYTLTANYPSS
jgi:hypothetical protein